MLGGNGHDIRRVVSVHIRLLNVSRAPRITIRFVGKPELTKS